MNEVICFWFLGLALSILYTWLLYDGTFSEKVKFVCGFMIAFTLLCAGVLSWSGV